MWEPEKSALHSAAQQHLKHRRPINTVYIINQKHNTILACMKKTNPVSDNSKTGLEIIFLSRTVDTL